MTAFSNRPRANYAKNRTLHKEVNTHTHPPPPSQAVGPGRGHTLRSRKGPLPAGRGRCRPGCPERTGAAGGAGAPVPARQSRSLRGKMMQRGPFAGSFLRTRRLPCPFPAAFDPPSAAVRPAVTQRPPFGAQSHPVRGRAPARPAEPGPETREAARTRAGSGTLTSDPALESGPGATASCLLYRWLTRWQELSKFSGDPHTTPPPAPPCLSERGAPCGVS